MMMKAKGQECKQLAKSPEQTGTIKERLVQRPFHCYEVRFQKFYGSFNKICSVCLLPSCNI